MKRDFSKLKSQCNSLARFSKSAALAVHQNWYLNKKEIGMSKIVNVAASIIILGLAATGSANARPLSHHQPQPGYAGPASALHEPWEFVPGRGIVDESCDLPTSACPNEMRPN
jgi:hypothetical protein